MDRKINHGLNILRIISMMGIIGLHVLNAGGGIDRSNLLTLTNIPLSYCYILCACSVDTFAMMTGFLYEGRTLIRFKNLLNLLVTVFFYTVVISGCFYCIDRHLLSQTGLATALYPFRANRFWYIGCYVLLFVLIPYINILLNNLSDRQFDILVILLFLMTSMLPIQQRLDLFRMDWGYSSAWLIICYILGAYVKRKPQLITLGKSAVLFFVISLTTLAYSLYRLRYHEDSTAFKWATEYISPGIVAMSMLQINIYSKLNLTDGKLTKVITAISAAAFDVYIFHSHILIYDHLITDGFLFLQNIRLRYLIPGFVGSLAAIYVVGLICYKIRMALFGLFGMDRLLEKLGSFVDRKLFV